MRCGSLRKAKTINTDAGDSGNSGLIEVELVCAHRHCGKDYVSGDTITVTPDLKKWLESINAIKPPSNGAN